MLSEVKRKHSRSTMSIVNSAMNQNIRHAQAKAEMMMRRKDPYNNSMAKEIHQDWYFTGVVDTSTALAIQDVKLDTKLPADAEKLSVERSEETLSAIKRRFPHYLTKSGSVLSASLEINDELVCCVPGERSKSSRLKSSGADVHTQYGRQTHKDRQETAGTSTMDEVEACWQPLSTAALLEHSTVSAIPVRGIRHKAHGHYSMWKPNNIDTRH